MIKINNLIFLFVIIFFCKFLLNFYYYHRVKYLLKKYNEYLKNPEWEFSEYKLEIIKLFKNAGIKDVGVSISQNVGYRTLKVQNIFIFSNIVNRNGKIVNVVTETFYAAIGYYKLKFAETINPLFWIEFLVFIPKNISTYIGIKSNNIIINIFQILYWILGLLASIYAIFGLNIINYLLSQIK